MKDITPFIKKAIEDIRMTEAERALLWSRIQEYKAMKPVTHGVRDHSRSGIASIFSLALFARPLAVALVLVVVFTGGVSFAAESSLPGTPLYAIKTNINEPLRVALATTPEAKAEVQMQLAERRITEAAELAADGRLDAATQEKLALAFETHADTAASVVEEVASADSPAAVEISSRFETRLAAHESVLTRVRDSGDAAPLSDKIRKAGLAVATIRTRAEQKVAVSSDPDAAFSIAPMALSIGTETAMRKGAAPQESETTRADEADKKTAKRMQISAEKQLRKTEKKVDALRKISSEARTNADAEIAIATGLLAQGREHYKNGKFALAFHAFQEALIISEKLEVVVESTPALEKARARGSVATGTPRDDVSRGSSKKGEGVRTLSLPAAQPVSESLSSTTDDSNADAAALRIELADIPPSPLPPAKKIFEPVGETLHGVIQGASTSVELESSSNSGKNHDDKKDEGTSKILIDRSL